MEVVGSLWSCTFCAGTPAVVADYAVCGFYCRWLKSCHIFLKEGMSWNRKWMKYAPVSGRTSRLR